MLSNCFVTVMLLGKCLVNVLVNVSDISGKLSNVFTLLFKSAKEQREKMYKDYISFTLFWTIFCFDKYESK